MLGIEHLFLYDIARPSTPLLVWQHSMPRSPLDGAKGPLRDIPEHLMDGAKARMSLALALHPSSLAEMVCPASSTPPSSTKVVVVAAISDHVTGEVVAFPFEIDAPRVALLARAPPGPGQASGLDLLDNTGASQDVFLATLSQHEDIAGGLSQLSQGASQRRRLAGTQDYAGGGGAPVGTIEKIDPTKPLPSSTRTRDAGGAGPSTASQPPSQRTTTTEPNPHDTFFFQPRFLSLRISALGAHGIQIQPSLLAADPWDNLTLRAGHKTSTRSRDKSSILLQGEFLGGALPSLWPRDRRTIMNPTYGQGVFKASTSLVEARQADRDELSDSIPLLQGLTMTPFVVLPSSTTTLHEAATAPPSLVGTPQGGFPFGQQNPAVPRLVPPLVLSLTSRNVWNGNVFIDCAQLPAPPPAQLVGKGKQPTPRLLGSQTMTQARDPPQASTLSASVVKRAREEMLWDLVRQTRTSSAAVTATTPAAGAAGTMDVPRRGGKALFKVLNLPQLYAHAVSRLPVEEDEGESTQYLAQRVAEEAVRLSRREDVRGALEVMTASLTDPKEFQTPVLPSALGFDLWACSAGSFWDMEEEEGTYQL